jgi:hypothetical protein
MAQAPLLDGIGPNNRLGALFQSQPFGFENGAAVHVQYRFSELVDMVAYFPSSMIATGLRI